MFLARLIGSMVALGTLGACGSVADRPSRAHFVDSPLDAKLAAGLPAVLEASGAASVSVAHIDGGKVVALQAAGLSGPGQAATTQTRYNVASLTKPVTAEVVLRLVAAERFSLDQSMAGSWVDPDLAQDPRHERLTPRLSLNHQTGFPNWRDASGLKFERDPGGSPGYSGEGFEYVAKFVARLTNVDIDEHAERLLFTPLGMHATSYTSPSSDLGTIASSRANGTWSPPAARDSPSAADDLVTTAGDYAAFLVSLMRDEGLTPPLVAERSRIQADRRTETCAGIAASSCPDKAGFTLGWELFFIDGVPFYMHTGSDNDAFSLAYWTPATNSGTVILTNNADGYRAVLPVLDLLGANPKFVTLLREQASR